MFQYHDHDSRQSRGELPKTRSGHQGAGSARPFKPEELRLVLLQLMAERPRPAGALTKAIADRLGGAYAPSRRVIDPTLTMLEDLGHAVATTGADGERLYEVTAKGTVLLDGNRATVSSVFQRMRAVRSAAVAPQLLQPLETLRRALRDRLSRSDIDLEGIRAMAAAIEAATANVTRV
jgi:DNA-binding PadR family transcriptional regulator